MSCKWWDYFFFDAMSLENPYLYSDERNLLLILCKIYPLFMSRQEPRPLFNIRSRFELLLVEFTYAQKLAIDRRFWQSFYAGKQHPGENEVCSVDLLPPRLVLELSPAVQSIIGF